MANNAGMQSQGGFDSRTEQAFNQGNAGGQATAGASYSNGAYGNTGVYGNDGSADPFSFLNTGMSQLGINEGGDRRNGGGAKSPQ